METLYRNNHEATTTPGTLSAETIASYRNNGFVHIRGILTPEEAAHYQAAALSAAKRLKPLSAGSVFDQLVNVWQEDEAMRALTLHPNVAAVAQALAGVPLRLWHDQILIKQPKKSTPTEFHQDQPYWPHANSANPISAWIALCDVPVERGCMTFLPGSHRRTDLPAQNLGDASSLFNLCPDLRWSPRVTVPIRAGDCTFHHARCAHMATPNVTEEPRVAHIVIFMDETTTYTAKHHVVTDPLGLEEGAPIAGALFPAVGELIQCR